MFELCSTWFFLLVTATNGVNIGAGGHHRIFGPFAPSPTRRLLETPLELDPCCGAGRKHGPSVARIAAHEDRVAVDLFADPFPEERQRHDAPPVPTSWDDSTASFFDRTPPATSPSPRPTSFPSHRRPTTPRHVRLDPRDNLVFIGRDPTFLPGTPVSGFASDRGIDFPNGTRSDGSDGQPSEAATRLRDHIPFDVLEHRRGELSGLVILPVADTPIDLSARQKSRANSGSEPPEQVDVVGLLVGDEDSAPDDFPLVLLHLGDAESRDKPTVHLTVGPDGIAIDPPDDQSVPNADGCGGDAPTLCPQNPAAARKFLTRLAEDTSAAGRSGARSADVALTAKYRLDELPELLANLDYPSENPPDFALSVNHEVPVALIAGVAGRLPTYVDEEHIMTEAPPSVRLAD